MYNHIIITLNASTTLAILVLVGTVRCAWSSDQASCLKGYVLVDCLRGNTFEALNVRLLMTRYDKRAIFVKDVNNKGSILNPPLYLVRYIRL